MHNLYTIVTFGIAPLLGLTTLLLGIKVVKMRFTLYDTRMYLHRVRSHLGGHELANRQLADALWSQRNIFDHIGSYVPMDPRLNQLLFELANALPRYARQLPDILTPIPEYCRENITESTVPDLPREFRDGEGIDLRVKDINDPVFNILWEARTPWAISEMLRHGLFLAFGYTHSVAAWSPEGVNLKVTEKDPGYTNWGCLKLEALKGHKSLWANWRETRLEDNIPR